MTSELFESREDDLLHICSNIRYELAEHMPKCSGGMSEWAWRFLCIVMLGSLKSKANF